MTTQTLSQRVLPRAAQTIAAPLVLALWTALGCLVVVPVVAAETEEPAPDRIEVFPESISLHARRDYAQLVVTGHYADGQVRDLTGRAELVSSDPTVVAIEQARCVARGDGAATIEAHFGGQTITAKVEVIGSQQPDPVRFLGEVLPALTKQGCNAGSCHGSPDGKGGFALSMLAYKPSLDQESLIEGGLARRIEPIAPLESLLLKKPLLRVTHVGGKRLQTTDVAYTVLRDWIAEGAQLDPAGSPRATGMTVYPGPSRVIRAPHLTQQLCVQAQFADGSLRDVTRLATYSSSDPTVAVADADGLVAGRNRGQAAITVRYLDFVKSVYFTVIHPVEGFAATWGSPPEFNVVDRLVNRKLQELQYLPGGLCDDGTLIRRAYLDLTGLLPPADDVRAFLADETADKRARLFDDLLASEEFARFWALRAADLLRVNPNLLPDGRAELFYDWLVDSFRRNQPFDEFVRQTLTAAGDTREVAPANYFQAIASIEDLTESTAQLFMGSRVNCAKCHNHPFENWTQDDYYRLSAVFSRVSKQDDMVLLVEQGESRHPATGEVMKPWGSDAIEPTLVASSDRRALFADWLTKAGNPFFARVEVNRIWAHLLGRGIVHPVDDFRSSNPPSNAELLDELAAEFERTGFDRKHIIRLICNSHAYQRSAATNDLNRDDATLFSHVTPRRLSAEQLHDAVGYVGRSLPPTSALAGQIAEVEQRMEARRIAIAADQPAWEQQLRARVQTLPLWGSAWWSIGPFSASADNAWEQAHDATFMPQVKIDLAAEIDPRPLDAAGQPIEGQSPATAPLRWTQRPAWWEGRPQTIAVEPGAFFVFRWLRASEAGVAVLELSVDDAVRVWLDDAEVSQVKARRKFQDVKDKVTLTLSPGEHRLLIKVSHAAPSVRFSAQLTQWNGQPLAQADAPANAVEYVAGSADFLPAEARDGAIAYRQASDAELNQLASSLRQLRQRMNYYTQRPYPERSQFTEAFGQPKRETPCACERSSDPTVDQALVLLNGAQTHEAAIAGAGQYAQIQDDRQLTDEIFLSAFARLPTDRERAVVAGHLSKAKDRVQGIHDLLWAVFNTQEFLFQH